MPLDIRKRDNPDALRQFWQLEVPQAHVTITRGHVGKLADDTQFLVTKEDALGMFEGLCWALRDMGVTPEEVGAKLAILIREEDGH